MGNNEITEAKTILKSSYSTGEVNTGAKWTDGKDIYKRTITINTGTSSTNYAHGINIDTPIDLEVISVGGAATGILVNTTTGYFFRLNATNVQMYVLGSIGAETRTFTLYYTKI